MTNVRSFRLTVATLFTSCGLLAGCVGMPSPEGFEAALIDSAERLPVLAPSQGSDASSIARNGLLLSPTVREAASRVSASADEVKVQRAALFPGLSLAAGGGVSSVSNTDPEVQLTGSQLLFDGGNSRRAVEAADFDLQISYIAFQKSVDTALFDILAASDAVEKNGELLTVYRRQLKALQNIDTLVQTRVESGAVSVSDRLEARKRVQSATFLVNDTELALAEARDKLLLLSGQSEGMRYQSTSDSCEISGDADDLLTAHLELGRAQVSLVSAERALVPSLLVKPVVGGEWGVSSIPVGVNVDVRSDLLQGGALTAKANIARSNLAAAEARIGVARLEDEILQNGFTRSRSAGTRKSSMLRSQIDLLAQTRTLYRSQYSDMGTRRLAELLDNEEEYYARQAELIVLKSELAAVGWECAIRSRQLRKELDVEQRSIYGFPLVRDRI